MRKITLHDLPDQAVLDELNRAASTERGSTARVIALIAEADARRLYLAAGFPSMHAYCLAVLHMCDDSAFRRIHVARTARRFPDLLGALTDGRLNLTAIGLLAPHLTAENVRELITSASHRTATDIRRLLAERAPRLELSSGLHPLPATPTAVARTTQHAPEHVSFNRTKHAPAIAPIGSGKFELNVVVDESTNDLIRYARELEGSRVRGGESQLLHRALQAYVAQLEKRRFAKTSRPQARGEATGSGGRHLPAAVKRTVWERDGGQCTFTSDDGHRCPARTDLEFDHEHPHAMGGHATVENLRLRCRAHNQFTAEQELGAEFMERKREEAKERRAAAAREQLAKLEAETETVSPYLRALGFNHQEVRRGALLADTMPGARLEDQVRAAIQYLRPKQPSHVPC